MAELIYTEGFITDMIKVEQATKRAEIMRTVDLLSSFPELGSSNMPLSIRERFETKIRKLAVNPFLVIYEYDQQNDAVYIYGLDHQREAW